MPNNSSNDFIDPELVKYGDPRNVSDQYKTWTVRAIAADLAKQAFPLHIAIENYQHDYNIGSIVRSANAFNVTAVHIIGKKHWNRRGAMATEKYLRIEHHKSTDDFLDWRHQQATDFALIGIDNIAGSIPLSHATLPRQSILVFGQEGPGLSEHIQQACAHLIAIEQFGSTRSVNVGVAAGIILYEYVRRHTLAKDSSD